MTFKLRLSIYGESMRVKAQQVNRWFVVYPNPQQPPTWRIGHLASGYPVQINFPTRQASIRAAKLLDALTQDWDFQTPRMGEAASRWVGFDRLCHMVARGESVGVCGRYRV